MPDPAPATRPPLKARLLARLAATVARVLSWFWRLEIQDPAGVCVPGQHERPMIWVFWHNRILPMPIANRKRLRHRNMFVLTSASKDGEILAQTMACFGLGAVRGSSSRRGAQALRELVAVIKRGDDVIITPDGPRGPSEILQPGVAQLAALTGAPVVPIRVTADRPWVLRTWDKFQVPRPFRRVVVHFGEPITIAKRPTEAEFEDWRLRLEALLRRDADDRI